MKIEKMCSKQDLIINLRKASQYSRIDNLRKLSEYVQQELELENLKELVTIEHYEVRMIQGSYEILKIKSKYDDTKNKWLLLKEEVVQTISIDEIERLIL